MIDLVFNFLILIPTELYNPMQYNVSTISIYKLMGDFNKIAPPLERKQKEMSRNSTTKAP